VALRILDVSWSESNHANIFLPQTAVVMKGKEWDYDSINLPVCINIFHIIFIEQLEIIIPNLIK